jgi:DNA-binding HxlR family transcriptional regulator
LEGTAITTPPPPAPLPPRSPAAVDWTAAQAAVRIVSNKWVIPILAALADGPLRHSELHRAIGPAISQKVLTETLRLMQHNDLVAERKRVTGATKAPYTLTPSAEELLEPLTALARWHAQIKAN